MDIMEKIENLLEIYVQEQYMYDAKYILLNEIAQHIVCTSSVNRATELLSIFNDDSKPAYSGKFRGSK